MVEETHGPERDARPEAEIRYPDGRIEHPAVRFERSDVNFGWIMSILIVSICLATLMFLALLWFFHNYRDYQAAIKKSPFPLAPTQSQALPPEPRLEPLDRVHGIETSNAYERQAAKEETLNHYGRTAEPGFVHIPIDRAMTVLEKKLPVRKEPAASQAKENGLLDEGASNSGRLFRGKPQWSER
jgi:hypothetical protein